MSRDDYKLTITQAIEEMKHKQGDSLEAFMYNVSVSSTTEHDHTHWWKR